MEQKPIPTGEEEPLEQSPVSTGSCKAVKALGQGTGGHTSREQQGCGNQSRLRRAILQRDLNSRRQETRGAGSCSQFGMVPSGVFTEGVTEHVPHCCQHRGSLCLEPASVCLAAPANQGLPGLCWRGLIYSAESKTLQPKHLFQLQGV